ncbi:MAG: serine hydrolase domain-containing protein [Bryobacteraceae bacterium]
MQRRQFLTDILSSPMIAASWRHGPPPWLEVEILHMMAVAPVPGAITGILQNGSLAWIRPLGVRNVESKDPVTRDTVFQAASLSKQVTAYAAFALRDAGKLDFDRTLVSYVDDLADPRVRRVTLRHVLSHCSGFPNWRDDPATQLASEFEPGSKFQYSGEGFFYLQRILEQVTGKGFCEIIEGMVFRPLGMTSSSMIWKPELAGRFAVPHDGRGEPRSNWDRAPKRLHEIAERKGQTVATWKYADYEAATREAGDPPTPNYMLPNAAASMVTTAPDYARFLAAAIRNPEIRKEQIRFRPLLSWGLGWGIERIERMGGREYVWQWGDNGGYKNFVAAEPASGDAVFVFTNGDSGARIYDRIVTHATGHDHPALFWV